MAQCSSSNEDEVVVEKPERHADSATAIIGTGVAMIIAFVMISLLFLVYGDRKIWAAVQMRRGPNVVGPWGLLTPIADAVKLIFKEIIVPTAANKGLFFLGPVMTIMPALAAWAARSAPSWPTSSPPAPCTHARRRIPRWC